MIRRAWIWAFGPHGEGFALLCAIVAAAAFYLLIVAGCVAVIAALTAVFG